MAHSEKGHRDVTEGKNKDFLKIFIFIICISFVILLSLYIGSRLGIKYYTTHYNVSTSETGVSSTVSKEDGGSKVVNSLNDVAQSVESSNASESKSASSGAKTSDSKESSEVNTGSGQFTAYVNTSSKTFHLDKDCYHCKRIKEGNLLEFHYNSVQEIIDSGYKACGTCAADYK